MDQPRILPPAREVSVDANRIQLADWSDKIANLQRALIAEKSLLAESAWKTALSLAASAYLTAAHVLRRLNAQVFDWPWTGVLLGSVAVGAAFTVVFLSWTTGFVAAICGAILLAMLFYWPNEKDLQARRDRMLARHRDRECQRERARQSIPKLEEQLVTAEGIRARLAETVRQKERLASQAYRLEQFLRENWKAMRGDAFEEFLTRVFTELGYEVYRVGGTGDQGADLILCRDGRRIVLQLKGYVNSVSNGAVQEAYAAKAFHRCHVCAVITNSLFTASAKELAARVGCILVDENLLPTLVLGRFSL
jgi:hypothetical protein